MAEQKKARKKQQPRRTYVHRSNAMHITIYSQNGAPVPRKVLEEAAESVTNIALKHQLLIGLAET